MPTVVLNLTQKISAIIRPLRQSLPSERSLCSAHRLSAEPRSKTNTCGPMSTRKGQAASVTLLRREQLRSASAPTNSIVDFLTSIRRKSRARLWSMEGPGNHSKGSPVVSFLFLLEPKGDPAQRSAFGKEEGGCEYGAFAAPAEAEWSRHLLTLRWFFSFSEKRKKRMGRKKRRWASAHLSISLLFALQVTPIISQRYLAGARRRRRTRRLCRGRSARR